MKGNTMTKINLNEATIRTTMSSCFGASDEESADHIACGEEYGVVFTPTDLGCGPEYLCYIEGPLPKVAAFMAEMWQLDLAETILDLVGDEFDVAVKASA